jgi:hypothetical protein
VRAGDSLQSIAQAVWGDASLWYMIAEANGLSASSSLSAGQSLSIPAKVSNFHNTSATFKPYDPNKAIGDTQPGSPAIAAAAAAKKGCGVVGQIIMVAIAVAVTIATSGAAVALATGSSFASGISTVLGASVLGGSALTASTAGVSSVGFGAILAGAGAVGSATGSIVSQLVGGATGIQPGGFSWKSVAMAGIAGGIGGAMRGLGAAVQAGESLGTIGNLAFKTGGVGGTVIRAALGSIGTQGLSGLAGLQKRFDWKGVAAASIAAAVSYGADDVLGAKGFSAAGGNSIGNHLAHLGSSGAALLANAATRSLTNGTDFGDNIIAALPDVIVDTLGNIVKHGVVVPQKAKDAAGGGFSSLGGFGGGVAYIDMPEGKGYGYMSGGNSANAIKVVRKIAAPPGSGKPGSKVWNISNPEISDLKQINDNIAEQSKLIEDYKNDKAFVKELTADKDIWVALKASVEKQQAATIYIAPPDDEIVVTGARLAPLAASTAANSLTQTLGMSSAILWQLPGQQLQTQNEGVVTISRSAVALGGSNGFVLSSSGMSLGGDNGLILSSKSVSAGGVNGLVMSGRGISAGGPNGFVLSSQGIYAGGSNGFSISSKALNAGGKNGLTINGKGIYIAGYGLTAAGVGRKSVAVAAERTLITDVRAINAADANAPFLVEGWSAPYSYGSQARSFTANADLDFMRVTVNRPEGAFLVRAKEIAGMTPEQIQVHLALPKVPTNILPVRVPAGTRMQAGFVGPQPSFNVTTRGGIQYQLLDQIPSQSYGNMRPIR